MAGAIEDSKVVLICFSSQYKQSPSCRTEAEYTYKLKKPFIPIRVEQGYRPDGWLGMMIGAKLYIDITDGKQFDHSISKLCSELGRVGAISNGVTVFPEVGRRVYVDKLNSREVMTWSQDTVLSFLFEQGLEHDRLISCFEHINGSMLVQLQYMQKHEPKYLYKQLQKLEMTFTEVVKFTSALNKIE